MKQNQAASIEDVREIRKIQIDIERVMIWALVFTNFFSISYFFAKLFKWV
jgi:hypothetical protein